MAMEFHFRFSRQLVCVRVWSEELQLHLICISISDGTLESSKFSLWKYLYIVVTFMIFHFQKQIAPNYKWPGTGWKRMTSKQLLKEQERSSSIHINIILFCEEIFYTSSSIRGASSPIFVVFSGPRAIRGTYGKAGGEIPSQKLYASLSTPICWKLNLSEFGRLGSYPQMWGSTWLYLGFDCVLWSVASKCIQNYFVATPLKFNMEPENHFLESIIFSFHVKLGVCGNWGWPLGGSLLLGEWVKTLPRTCEGLW